MAMTIDKLGALIISHLTPDLLSPQFANIADAQSNPLFGHCYVASEALYHLAGGKKSGMKPRRLEIAKDQWHWWLVDREGHVVDLTAGQFDRPPDYTAGLRTAFLSKQPSKRAQKLIARSVATALKGVTPDPRRA